MPTDFLLPWPTSYWAVLGVFICAWVLCDLILIRFAKFGILAWRRVDYVWLSMALIGVATTTMQTRQEYAENLLTIQKTRHESILQFMTAVVTSNEIGCSPLPYSGANKLTSEESRMHHEISLLQCAWFSKVLEKLDKTKQENVKLELSSLLNTYPRGADYALHQRVEDLFEEYQVTEASISNLQAQSQLSDSERMFRYLGPIVIAFALGLRMAKVTAEVRMDKEKLKAVARHTVSENHKHPNQQPPTPS